MTKPQEPPVGTLDRIEAMAPAFLVEKTARLIECDPVDATTWLANARTAGVQTEAGLVHTAYLQQRLADMRRDALIERSNPAIANDPVRLAQVDRRLHQIDETEVKVWEKYEDGRLSEEQHVSDGYRLVRSIMDQRYIDLTDITDTRIRQACSKYSFRNMVRICRGKGRCVSPPAGYEAQFMSPKLSDEINVLLKTNIDFVQLSHWEGGQNLYGYVPWYQGFPRNVSGVTIGTGIDLGQTDLASLTRFARAVPPPPGLIDKLKPYLGLKMQNACDKLSDIPLQVTQEEVEWLDKWRIHGIFHMNVHHDKAGRHWMNLANKFNELRQEKFPMEKLQYDAAVARRAEWEKGPKTDPAPDVPASPPLLALFGDLPQREQTVLFSRLYHGGSGVDGVKNISLLSDRNWSDIWAYYRPIMTKDNAYTGRYNLEYSYYH